MKRLLLTITLIMAFVLTAYAGHEKIVTPAENLSAQEHTILGHENVAFTGHPD